MWRGVILLLAVLCAASAQAAGPATMTATITLTPTVVRTPTRPYPHRRIPDRNGDNFAAIALVGSERFGRIWPTLDQLAPSATSICDLTRTGQTSAQMADQMELLTPPDLTFSNCSFANGTLRRGPDVFADEVLIDVASFYDFDLTTTAPRPGRCWPSGACRVESPDGFVDSWETDPHAKCISGPDYRTPCRPARYGTPTPCADGVDACQPWVFADGEAGVHVTNCAVGMCQQQTDIQSVYRNLERAIRAVLNRGAIPILVFSPMPTGPTLDEMRVLYGWFRAKFTRSDPPLGYIDLTRVPNTDWDLAFAVHACIEDLATYEQPELEFAERPVVQCKVPHIPASARFTPWPTRTPVVPTATPAVPTRTNTRTTTVTPTATETPTITPGGPTLTFTTTATATSALPEKPLTTFSFANTKCQATGPPNSYLARRMDDMKRIAVDFAECYTENAGANSPACTWWRGPVKQTTPAFSAWLPYASQIPEDPLFKGIRMTMETKDRDINRKEYHAAEDKLNQCPNDALMIGHDWVRWQWRCLQECLPDCAPECHPELGPPPPYVPIINPHPGPANGPASYDYPFDVFNNFWEPYFYIPALEYIAGPRTDVAGPPGVMQTWPIANNAACVGFAMDRFTNGIFDLWNGNGSASQKCGCENFYTTVKNSPKCAGATMPTAAQWFAACQRIKELYRPLYEGVRLAEGQDLATIRSIGYPTCPTPVP